MNKNFKQSTGASDPDAEWHYVRAFQDFVGELFRLNTLFLSTADKYVQDQNVTTSEWRVIASIQFGDSKTVPQIARYVGISRQAVRQTVQKLEAKNLIRLNPNPDHRRSPLVSLTPKGQKLMRALTAIQTRMTHLYTDGLQLDIEWIRELTEKLETLRAHAENVGEKK